MIEATTVKDLIQELIDWNYGTVYKGYDSEELAETLEDDTRQFLVAILKAHKAELATPNGKDMIPQPHSDAEIREQIIDILLQPNVVIAPMGYIGDKEQEQAFERIRVSEKATKIKALIEEQTRLARLDELRELQMCGNIADELKPVKGD